MSALKFFTFFVMNDDTREIATFIGQGSTMDEAWRDAMKLINEKFRPDSNGGGDVQKLCVHTQSGQVVHRFREEFESSIPHPVEEDCPA
jgi:hypothetical protein